MTTQNQTDKYPWLTHIESFEIRGQIVTIAHDGPDEDEHPDVNAPIGRVIFEYASEFGFKYTNVEDGRPRSIFLMPETVVAPILSDGTIGSPDMKIEETDGVVRLMPTSVEGLEPSDTTIKATIQLDNYSSKWPPIYFTAKPGDRLNLADLIPEDYFPGVITVVDDSILRQTLYASNQAFDYQEEAKSHAEKAGQSLTKIQKSITNIDSKVSEAQQHATKAETHASEIVGKNTEASRILGESKTILIDTGKLLSSAQSTSKTINEAKLFFDNIYQEHGMLKGDKGDRGPQGLKGDKGETGIQGPKGVGITQTTIEYAQTRTNEIPTDESEWFENPPEALYQSRYVWTRTVWTYSDNSTKTGYSVSWIGIKGEKGDKGDKGDPGPSIKGDKGDKGDPGPPIKGVVPITYDIGSGGKVLEVEHGLSGITFYRQGSGYTTVHYGDRNGILVNGVYRPRFELVTMNLTGEMPKQVEGLYADSFELKVPTEILQRYRPAVSVVKTHGYTTVNCADNATDLGHIVVRVMQIKNSGASALKMLGIVWIEDN